MATDTGYATPKVGVRGVVFQDDRLLFVKERVDDRWTLPGGWTEPGESASESVVREIREESGFQTRPVKLLAVYDRQRHPLPPHPYHVYVIYFRCELLGGEPAESLETNGVAFFDEAAAGNLPLGRVTPQQVARMFDHRRHPEWPADFD
jgi:ADP-ribose pyrophosphatase YjhB (NUDIX family)